MTFTTIQTNFTGGEQSPRVRDRIDVDKRNNGVKDITNMLPVIHGGVRSTPGTEFIAAAKFSDRKAILLKFEYAKDQSLMLEIGHLYIRFFDQDGIAIPDPITPANPYEIATLFTETQLPEVNYNGAKDTIFFWHPDVYSQRLRRFANDHWVIDNVPFDPMPFDELGHTFNEAVTLSSASIGTGRTLTVDSTTSIFLAGDVGRTVTYQGGEALITAQTGNTATADITATFSGTAISANDWVLESTPQVVCTPSKASPVGDSVDLTAAAASWRSEDIGRHVEINGGLVRIDSITSPTIAAGVIRRELSTAVASPADAWVLNAPIFSAALGYPRCGAFYKQRLIMAGTITYPNVFWASKIRLFFDFELGDFSDDAIFYELDLEDNNPIIDIGLRSKQMVMMSTGGEILVNGDANGFFTPLNIDTNNASNFGSKRVKSLRVRKDLCFIQRGGLKVRAVEYKFTNDEFDSVDITKLAEHITSPGIVDITYQQEPDSQLWSIRSDGVAVSLTIDRDEQVIAWAKQTTQGSYEAIEAMPGISQLDDLWVIVQRVIDGGTVRYIERFKDSLPSVHSAVELSGSAQTVWSGFDHLEGETLELVADGIIRTQVTVSGGQITTPAADEIVAGMPYPDRPRVELYPPEVRDDFGTSQGNKININKVIVGLLNSGAIRVEGVDYDGRQFGSNLLDQPAPILNGDITLPNSGWEMNKTTTIEAATALPIHILSVKRKVVVARQ